MATETKPTLEERVKHAIDAVGWLVDNYNDARTEGGKAEALKALDKLLVGSKDATPNVG